MPQISPYKFNLIILMSNYIEYYIPYMVLYYSIMCIKRGYAKYYVTNTYIIYITFK